MFDPNSDHNPRIFWINSLPLNNKIGKSYRKSDSVDIPDGTDDDYKFDSVDIDEETYDDGDEGIVVSEKEIEDIDAVPELANNTQIEIKLNNVTFNNMQLEIMKNGKKKGSN